MKRDDLAKARRSRLAAYHAAGIALATSTVFNAASGGLYLLVAAIQAGILLQLAAVPTAPRKE